MSWPGEGRLHGFLHDLPDLSGHGESSLALHCIGFDEQHVAARRSPGQAHGNPRSLGALGNLALAANLDATQELLDDFAGDNQFLRLAFGQTPRLLAADCANGSF